MTRAALTAVIARAPDDGAVGKGEGVVLELGGGEYEIESRPL